MPPPSLFSRCRLHSFTWHAAMLKISLLLQKSDFLRLRAEISLSLFCVWCNATLSMTMGTAIGL